VAGATRPPAFLPAAIPVGGAAGKTFNQGSGVLSGIGKKIGLSGLMLAALLAVAGCGESPDVEMMKAGLARSGMPADQANCFAEKMSETVDGEPYNYMARLMKEGLDEKSAVNKTRRKYTAEFKGPMQEARAACVK
jgi:hypothetical protein